MGTWNAPLSNAAGAPVSRGKVDSGALVALGLGLASVLLFLLAVTGIPALIIGLRAVRRVNSSEGELRGSKLALIGMVLGGLGTLITLVGIIAMIVVKVQVTSRELQGVENLRRIGGALNRYYDSHTGFPPATRDPAALKPEQRLSWMAELLPMYSSGKKQLSPYESLMEAIDHSKGWDDPANKQALNTVLRLYQTPLHPDYDPRQIPGVTHFVGISGIGPDAAFLSRRESRAGMFGHDRGVVRDEIERGQSLTLFVLETAFENGPWLAGGRPTVRDVPEQGKKLIGVGEPFGGISPGKVQGLWVDGSVRAFRDDSPGDILRKHATLRP